MGIESKTCIPDAILNVREYEEFGAFHSNVDQLPQPQLHQSKIWEETIRRWEETIRR